MIADERLVAIETRLARLQRRVDSDDVGWLVRACDELLVEVRRLTPTQPRLLDVAS